MVNSTTSYAWSRIYSAGSRNSSRKQNVETTNMITSFLQAVTCMYISPAEYRKSLVESKDTLISEQHFHFAGTLEKRIDSSQVFGQESIFCKTMATWKCSPEFCVPILYRALLPRTSHERRDWSLRTHFRTPFFCHSESLWMSAQDLPPSPTAPSEYKKRFSYFGCTGDSFHREPTFRVQCSRSRWYADSPFSVRIVSNM